MLSKGIICLSDGKVESFWLVCWIVEEVPHFLYSHFRLVLSQGDNVAIKASSSLIHTAKRTRDGYRNHHNHLHGELKHLHGGLCVDDDGTVEV